jgi:hypothetical protein
LGLFGLTEEFGFDLEAFFTTVADFPFGGSVAEGFEKCFEFGVDRLESDIDFDKVRVRLE